MYKTNKPRTPKATTNLGHHPPSQQQLQTHPTLPPYSPAQKYTPTITQHDAPVARAGWGPTKPLPCAMPPNARPTMSSRSATALT